MEDKAVNSGMGLSAMNITEPERQNRLLLLGALADELLGTAGEGLGMGRFIDANTSKRHTDSSQRVLKKSRQPQRVVPAQRSSGTRCWARFLKYDSARLLLFKTLLPGRRFLL